MHGHVRSDLGLRRGDGSRPVPDKGRVLTAMSAFWFEQFADLVRSHLLGTDLADLPADDRRPEWAGRIMVCRSGRDVARRVHRAGLHHRLGLEGVPAGRDHARRAVAARSARVGESCRSRSSPRRPRPRSVTTTRTSPSRRRPTWSASSWPSNSRDVSLELYRRGAEWAATRGIIIADTKFELGLVDGELVLCDEVLTPDSSRFWPADQWQPGSHTAVVRQAARARLPRRARLGQDAAAADVARRRHQRHLGPLPGCLRAHHRPVARRLAAAVMGRRRRVVRRATRPPARRAVRPAARRPARRATRPGGGGGW